MTRPRSAGWRRSLALALPLTALLLTVAAAPASAVGGTSISSSGPLTSILVGNDTQCQVFYAGDDDPEFYGSDDSGACGTFVALAGTLYGPATVPAGGSASPRTAFTPVSQSDVTGAGTVADPFRLTTVVDLGTSGFRLTEIDSYVVGQEAYLTTVTLENNSGAAQSPIIYRAGDCYLQNSDDGFGQVDGRAVSCRSTVSERIEQWYPITPGSTYMEDEYDVVWERIGSQQPFADTCRCGTAPGDEHDNGAGLSWVRPVAPGQSTSVSHYTTFSPLGIQPLVVTKAADSASTPAGGTNGYTITIDNPAPFEVTLDSISDDLPAGFAYVAGSTTGATTGDPAVSGQNLTWGGPFSIAATSTLSLHFSVTVSGTPGTYTNSATAAGAGLVIIGAVDVAPIEVTAAPATTPTTSAPGPTTGGTNAAAGGRANGATAATAVTATPRLTG